MAKIEHHGDYKMRAMKAELSESGGGDPQVFVRLETSNGDHIDWYLGFKTEKAEKFAIKSLRSMGWRGSDLSRLAAEDLPNTVDVHIEPDTYNGVTRLKVKWVNGPDDAPMVKPLDQAKAMTFAERMKAKIVAMDAQAPAMSPTGKIPF